MKVLAAIVTHNRCALLSRCLDRLCQQSRAPDRILVINNSSTDGTVAMLQERAIAFITQPNTGAAGGWYTAIEYALQQNFDAVWLMDDDGYPDSAALAHLVKSLNPDVACVSSIVVREDAPELFVFPFPVLDDSGLPIIWGWPRKLPSRSLLSAMAPDGFYPFAHFFNGALISIKAVRQIGNVDCGFFIFGEEVDYFYRLQRVGHVVSNLNALHFHPDVSQRPYTPAKVYYYLKNTLILNRRYLNHRWLRHLLALMAVLGRTLHRNGIGATLSLLAGSDARSFYSAIVRGLQGKVGKDFNG